MRSLVYLLVMVIVFCFGFTCRATSYASPQRYSVFSPNGDYELVIDPETSEHWVYEVETKTKRWSFQSGVWHETYLLSNDGSTVAMVGWVYLSALQPELLSSSVVIAFITEAGVSRSYTIADLCPNPAKTNDHGPIGDHWYTWYDSGSLTQNDDTFTLDTTDTKRYTFDLISTEIVQEVEHRRTFKFGHRFQQPIAASELTRTEYLLMILGVSIIVGLVITLIVLLLLVLLKIKKRI